METATLTKPEEAHVERMADSFSQPTTEERFGSWASRVISEAKKEKKEEKNYGGPREMKGSSSEEREWIKKVGEKDESQSPRGNSTETDMSGRTEQRTDAKGEKPASESNDSPSQPLQGDRHWEALEGKVHLNEKELQDHWKNVDSRAGVVLQFVNQHPQKAQIEEGFRALMAGRPQGVDEPFFRDLSMALAEVPNPGEVFRHITLKTEDRNVLRNCKNWRELRAAIHTVSKHYAATSRPSAQPSLKPRAPKPPSEVGGRGAANDDGSTRGLDFTNFSQKMNERYARQAR